jgi:hypothetical protein
MTAKITSNLTLTGTLRLLAAFFAVAALTGCHVGFNFDGCPVEGCGDPPTQANLGGTLSGLVGSRLVLQNTLQNNSAGNPRFRSEEHTSELQSRRRK